MSNYGYIRIAQTTETYNIERQISYFSHIKIDKFFKDIGVSGIMFEKKGLNELLSTVKNGDNIYIRDFSRLSRNIIDGIRLLKSLHNKGVNVFTVQDSKIPLYNKLTSAMSKFIAKNRIKHK